MRSPPRMSPRIMRTIPRGPEGLRARPNGCKGAIRRAHQASAASAGSAARRASAAQPDLRRAQEPEGRLAQPFMSPEGAIRAEFTLSMENQSNYSENN